MTTRLIVVGLLVIAIALLLSEPTPPRPTPVERPNYRPDLMKRVK